jgi:hypothetical protein
MQLLVQKKTDPKTAGLLLYALQIASSNLTRMDEEEPEPEDVVVDLDKVAETPLETDFFEEHEEGIPDPPKEIPPPPPPQIVPQETVCVAIHPDFEPSLITVDRLRAAVAILQKGVADHESKMQSSEKPATQTPEKSAMQTSEKSGMNTAEDSGRDNSNDGLPPGTIQARARMPQHEKKSEGRSGYVN